MAYKFTFDKEQKPIYEWSKKENHSGWKKSKVILNEIFIKPSGRNVWSTPFRKNVIYKIYDYGIILDWKTHPLEVVVICDLNGNAIDVAIPQMRTRKYPMRASVRQLYDAIVLADIQYAKPGGGVLYTKPLHKNQKLLDELLQLLTVAKEKQ